MYVLDVDASDWGIGGVLSQVQDEQEKVIHYASRTLNKSQRNYCTTRKELLAIVNFVHYFRHYLYLWFGLIVCPCIGYLVLRTQVAKLQDC